MRLRFWGTRGSIPKPSRGTLRYGGNTSCVEVRSSAGTLIVIDCGTGAHALGQALMARPEQPVRGSLLISHTHWDHIQGLPFFAPLFVPENEWDIYAPHGLSQSLRDTLAGQMQYTYFPITLDDLGATIRYHDLVEGTLHVGDIEIHTHYLNHPAITLGYRLEADGVSVVYACDHEPNSRQAIPDRGELGGREGDHVAFLKDADLVIHDAQYTAAEYPRRVGWGHSTVDYAVAVCREAGVRRLILTHHDPDRDDDSLDAIVAEARAGLGAAGNALKICAAAEGETIEVAPAEDGPQARREPGQPGTRPVETADSGHRVALGTLRPGPEQVIRAAARAEMLQLIPVGADAPMPPGATARALSLIIVDAEAAPQQVDALREAFRAEEDGAAPRPPVLIISREADGASANGDVAADWLVWPFSEQYARTKIRASVLRAKCRWQRAQIPPDETERLADLYQLGILDTEPEERFDRFTRIVSSAFGVPIAVVSLVDKDRQWFKSCVGLDTRETSREVAFCAHALLQDEPLIVPDTLVDPRFADNPLVTAQPRIRFYAGCLLRSPKGRALGTLCLIDTQPRSLESSQVTLLKDLAALVEKEIHAAAGIAG